MSIKFTSYVKQVLSAEATAKARALEICGGMAEGFAKVNITRNRSVVTGVLRNSIAHKQLDENTEAIGSNVEYAPYVELGTSRARAKPYLRPALEGHIREYKEVIETELGKIDD